MAARTRAWQVQRAASSEIPARFPIALPRSRHRDVSPRVLPMMRVLLVEDDAELAREVAAGLREAGARVTIAATFADGLRSARLEEHDVLLLDVLLPGGSGFELCRVLRAEGITTPILMLTARDAVDDRVTGL